MPLDLILLLVLLLAFWRGWRKGIIMAVIALLAVVLGSLAAMKLGGVLAQQLFPNGDGGRWAPLICYAIMFTAVVWLVQWVGRSMVSVIRAMKLGWLNQAAGGAVYLLIAVFVASAVLYLAAGAGLVKEDTLAGSQLYQRIQPAAPWVFAHVGEVMPFAKDVYAQLTDLFDRAGSDVAPH